MTTKPLSLISAVYVLGCTWAVTSEGMCLEVPDVLGYLIHLLFLSPLDDIVGTGALVCGNEVRVEDAGEWHHGFHVAPELSLQANVEHLGPGHRLGHVQVADVPATEHNVVGINLQNK
jgi:hypothetical protein